MQNSLLLPFQSLPVTTLAIQIHAELMAIAGQAQEAVLFALALQATLERLVGPSVLEIQIAQWIELA